MNPNHFTVAWGRGFPTAREAIADYVTTTYGPPSTMVIASEQIRRPSRTHRFKVRFTSDYVTSDYSIVVDVTGSYREEAHAQA